MRGTFFFPHQNDFRRAQKKKAVKKYNVGCKDWDFYFKTSLQPVLG